MIAKEREKDLNTFATIERFFPANNRRSQCTCTSWQRRFDTVGLITIYKERIRLHQFDSFVGASANSGQFVGAL